MNILIYKTLRNDYTKLEKILLQTNTRTFENSFFSNTIYIYIYIYIIGRGPNSHAFFMVFIFSLLIALLVFKIFSSSIS